VILDGHNDYVLREWLGQGHRHIDLAAAAEVGFAGGFFALFPPGGAFEEPVRTPYALPPEPEVPREAALAAIEAEAYVLERLDVAIVRSADEIEPGRMNAIMHLEGAEAIAPDLSDLKGWYERGLRSIGITWSRSNAFGHGVPFAFPASPDTGPGLTPAGIELVHACNALGILVDVSHLNEAGFWDVARVTQAPLVATHSSVHALCASTRNLTDRQLDAIGASGGVVGINFGPLFLREDGHPTEPTPLGEVVRHVDYVARRIGVEHVAFGSDFEGLDQVPEGLDGIAGLPRLLDELRTAGYDGEALDAITHANWLRVLGDTLGHGAGQTI
jgi:membrane dipeptidase